MPERTDLWRDIRSDDDAERALADLGPLIQRKEQAEGLDPAFRTALRARLMTPAARIDRSWAGPSPGIPAWTVRRSWRWSWVGIAATLAAVLVVVLLLHGRGTGSRPVAVTTPSTPLLHPPPPAVADLLRAAPPSFTGGSGGLPIPELSGFDTRAAGYKGHLALAAPHLPAGRSFLPAYRLKGPSFDDPRMAALARLVGINQPVTRTVSPVDHDVWDVAATGGPGSNQPLHSLAISRHTGELIYHGAPNNPSSPPAAPIDRVRAVTLSRRWIASLGWPRQLPVLTAAPDTELLPPSAGIPWQVSLGWRGVGAAAETQATVIVMPNGDVIEARLLPPIAKTGHVATRSVPQAWRLVRTGKVPVVVAGMGAMAVSGHGSERHMAVIWALDTSGAAPYLVPMDQFTGSVSLGTMGVHSWSALVAAARARP